MPWTDNGVDNPPSSNLLGHAGGGAGTVAFVGFDAVSRHGAVVLTNQMKVHPSPVGWTLVQQMPFTSSNTLYAVREVVGVGIALEKDSPSDDLRIIKVFRESPAGKAGINVDNVITMINETAVEAKSLQECYKMLSGEANTQLRLHLRETTGAEVNSPLSLVILFLGTNDFQAVHQFAAAQSAQGVSSLVAAIRRAPIEPGMQVPGVMIVAPPSVQRGLGEIAAKFDGAEHKALGLSDAFRSVAEELQCNFFDAGEVTTTSKIDGVHLDAEQHCSLGAAIAARVVPILKRPQNDFA